MKASSRHARLRQKVVFKHQARKLAAMAASQQPAPASRDSSTARGATSASDPVMPNIFRSAPVIQDALVTDSSQLQDDTLDECLPFLTGYGHEHCNMHGIPPLLRGRHVKFLHKQLGMLPPTFKSADASRPWVIYWCLAALSLLGEDVASYRSRLIETFRPMQNKTGGIAGGFGQTSHLATTYAAVLALAMVGGDDAYDLIDRRSMWRWLCSLKQPDGGFQMAAGGEEDVRGAYCASVIISLLNIPRNLSTDSPACSAGHTDLFDGLPEWVARCQTYEGGVSAAPGLEAHGAYAFCALGCLSIIDSPHRTVPKYLNVPRLISWLSSRQYAPEGGFSGRTNKLVDGCYSHWVGGCWPLIEASLGGPEGQRTRHADSALAEASGSLFSRSGLIRYILCCCQDLSKRGGLRDKPSKYSDAYHTCYVLAGLSFAQHKWTLASARADALLMHGDAWTVAPFKSDEEQIFEENDRVATTHPVYVIPQRNVDDCQRYFASKIGF